MLLLRHSCETGLVPYFSLPSDCGWVCNLLASAEFERSAIGTFLCGSEKTRLGLNISRQKILDMRRSKTVYDFMITGKIIQPMN